MCETGMQVGREGIKRGGIGRGKGKGRRRLKICYDGDGGSSEEGIGAKCWKRC